MCFDRSTKWIVCNVSSLMQNLVAPSFLPPGFVRWLRKSANTDEIPQSILQARLKNIGTGNEFGSNECGKFLTGGDGDGDW